ncbi:MAG: hypothetical protein JW712_06005 [Dehalococcoidales bacterium]|nr:hypothetical protein [Dehalococcoidales bacterium]
MEPKEAIDILQALLKKDILSDEEKTAVETALGMLSWSSLARSNLKARKAKRDQKRNTEW